MEVYFPIEFTAPEANKDSFGITKEQYFIIFICSQNVIGKI